jgi:hypothetical protein
MFTWFERDVVSRKHKTQEKMIVEEKNKEQLNSLLSQTD